MLKAYKIETNAHLGFTVYVAENAGRAKTKVIYHLGEFFQGVDYSWITSCHRAPEFDYLANRENEDQCVAWKHAGERWQIDRGHWWGGAGPSPVTPPNTNR